MISYILRIVSIFILNLFSFLLFLFLNFLYGEESVGCYEATVAPLGFGMSTESDYLTRQEAHILKYAYPPPIRYFKNPDSKDESK